MKKGCVLAKTNRMYRRCAKAVGASLALLAVGTAFFYSYSVVRRPERKKNKKNYGKYEAQMREGIRWFRSQNPEKIYIKSEDGLNLFAYYLPADEPGRKLILMMHGYRAEELADFSNLYRSFHEAGYDLLVPSQRSHGASEGRYICFGVKEREDCRRWAQYAAERFGEACSLYLAGISMGAATVLMAAGLPLPGNVKGILADCGYTSPQAILSHVLRRNFHLPPFPFMNLTEWVTRRRAGFGYLDADTLDVMKRCPIPVLFIHGGADDFVPVEMTMENYRACTAPKELLIIEGAGHAASSLKDKETYVNTALRFMQKAETWTVREGGEGSAEESGKKERGSEE